MSDEENPDAEPLIPQNEEPVVATPDPLKFKTLLVSVQTPELTYYRTMMVKPIPLLCLLCLSVFLQIATPLQVTIILGLMFVCLVVEGCFNMVLWNSFDDSKVLHVEIRRDHWASLMCPVVHGVCFVIACNVGFRFYLASGSLLAIYQVYLTIIIIGQLDASAIINPLTKKFTKITHLERGYPSCYYNIDKTGLPDGYMSITELN